MPPRLAKIIPALLICLLLLSIIIPVYGLAGRILNPYHDQPRWKLWTEDPSPVTLPDGKVISLPPPEKRLYPDDADADKYPGRFLAYRSQDWPERTYAGFWDDVYTSLDRGHSFLNDAWEGRDGNSVKIRAGLIHFTGGPLHPAGVNFTSQSTTGLGHDIVNDAARMAQLEKYFYFADVLTAGPAHVSLMDRSRSGSEDRYQALTPVFYNSVGSSGSETMALTKMIIAGGYLPRGLKPEMKRHGLYPSALLYLWKAALPYNVPFDSELRHRIAWNSQGDHSDYHGGNQTRVNHYYHNYDDTAHLRNMVSLARKTTAAPPEAILKLLDSSGGQVVYALKKTILIHQAGPGPVKLKVSAEDSYDLQYYPLTFRWKVLYGQKDTSIRGTGDSPVYDLTIPYSGALPQGRTSIILIAHNGRSDGNPAVINIYRTAGKANRRPALSGLADTAILPGETVSFDIKGVDPEGFPVTFYQWADQVGTLDGSRFTWTCPPDHPDGAEPVTIIASDGTAGNSYNSRQVYLRVNSTIADISADKTRGPAPLAVRFSSSQSRDKLKGDLKYDWDFDDGASSGDPNPGHVFTAPGVYEVALTVTGPSGTDTARRVITVEPDWPAVLTFDPASVPADQWSSMDLAAAPAEKRVGLLAFRKNETAGLIRESAENFTPPFYLEALLPRRTNKSRVVFDLLGTHIDASESVLASKSDQNGQWIIRPLVAAELPCPDCRTKLRVFITPDPRHPGKIRYAGFIVTGSGARFFKFDNQDRLHDKISAALIGSDKPADIGSFIIMAPAGSTDGRKRKTLPGVSNFQVKDACSDTPEEDYFQSVVKQAGIRLAKINVEGHGLNIASGSTEPNQADHTDFGAAAVNTGPVARTFTIHNPGARDLTFNGPPDFIVISGDNAADFTVVKQPRAVISVYGSSVFVIQFRPVAQGPRSAEVSINYSDSGPKQYVFHVRGMGL